ncbi:MAG: P-loop NTPase [Limnochordia bacterium]|jgi:flagellar biosynthesis protein FlhG
MEDAGIGRRRLAPGSVVILETDSPLYRGTYKCQVLEESYKMMRVSVPEEGGRLALIASGTGVRVRSPESDDLLFQGVVLARKSGAERCLVLVTPDLYPAALEQLPPAPEEEPKTLSRLVAVTSGKGGVGKTVLAVNLAVALAELGKQVCIVDGDLGTANVDVLLNLMPKHNLAHIVDGTMGALEVLVDGPGGTKVLPGASGLAELAALGGHQIQQLLEGLSPLDAIMDFILLDTGAGLGRRVTDLLGAVPQAILVTTPEPHAITDAYALMKVLRNLGGKTELLLVINMAENRREAELIADKMRFAAKEFLDYELQYLGFVPTDPAVPRAVRRQVDVLTGYGRSRAAGEIRRLAGRLAHMQVDSGGETGLVGLIRRIHGRLTNSTRDS